MVASFAFVLNRPAMSEPAHSPTPSCPIRDELPTTPVKICTDSGLVPLSSEKQPKHVAPLQDVPAVPGVRMRLCIGDFIINTSRVGDMEVMYLDDCSIARALGLRRIKHRNDSA